MIGISKSFDDADFQTWAENVFDPPPTFSYTEVDLSSGLTVGVFEVSHTESYPHVVATTVGNIIFEGQVWFRRGTKNTVALRSDLDRIFGAQEPCRFSHLDDPVLKQVIDDYRSKGRKPKLAYLADKDSFLARGYQLAQYPGTRREIRVGHTGKLQHDHILLLKPGGSA